MMNSNKPNIGAVMVLIHKAITRGLDVSSERSGFFAHNGFPDAAAQEGFVTYARTLGWLINAHHMSEDNVVFPYLKPKLPEAPFDQLSDDHKKMDEILKEIQVAVESIATQAPSSDWLNSLNSAVSRLANIWHPHIDIEQLFIYAIEKTEAVMTVDEQTKLIADAAGYSLQQGDPGFLVPFILYNLPAKDRAEMAQTMPTAIIQEMVPVVWKNKWEPMEPFLLE